MEPQGDNVPVESIADNRSPNIMYYQYKDNLKKQ